MKTREKTVSALEQKRQQILNNIEETEIKIGNRLLTAAYGAADASLVAQFTANAAEKQEKLRAIRDIETLTSKLKETRTLLADTKNCERELLALANERYGALGEALFAEYDGENPPCFQTHFDAAELVQSEIDETAKKVDELKEAIGKAPLFQKLSMQFNLSSLSATLANHNRRLHRILVDGGKEAAQSVLQTAAQSGAQGVNNAVKSTQSEQGANSTAQSEQATGGALQNTAQEAFASFSDSVKAAFEKCRSFTEEAQKQARAVNDLTEQEASVKAALLAQGVSAESGKKRIAHLRAAIQTLEDAQNKLCQKAGSAYAALYCTTRGEAIMECTGMASDLVMTIQTERANVVSYNRRIEIMKLAAAQDEADRKIAQFTRGKEEILKRIESLHQEKALYEEKIEAATAARDVIIGKRAALENEETASVKLIKEKPSAERND